MAVISESECYGGGERPTAPVHPYLTSSPFSEGEAKPPTMVLSPSSLSALLSSAGSPNRGTSPPLTPDKSPDCSMLKHSIERILGLRESPQSLSPTSGEPYSPVSGV
eukprot:sb/3477750/